MIVLSVSELRVSFGADVILDKVSFGIDEGDKVGVVGVNGAGKSVLFHAINGLVKPDCGEIFLSREKRIGYLRQNAGLSSKKGIFEEMTLAFPELVSAQKRLAALEKGLSEPNCSHGEHMRRVGEYTSLEETFRKNGGYTYESRIKSALVSMGFQETRHAHHVDTLSGGQKTKLALIKMLLSEPDILMLDEPTNHLDIPSAQWLEEYLRGYRKTFLAISHDRYFLDRVTQKTIEIEHGACRLYPCAYSDYVKRKHEREKTDEKHFLQQQKEIARLEAFIENQRKWNRERNIVAAESRRKAINRMVKLEKPKPPPARAAFSFSLGKGKRGSERMLEVSGLCKGYPGKPLFQHLSFVLHNGERMFFIGENGVGKSTLLKILSGKARADSGVFEYAGAVKIGYFDQEHQGHDPENTVLDELWNSYPEKGMGEIRGALARFLFRADDVYKKVAVLSGGEKARLTFAKLMLDEVNLLILDEPTNHLDAPSRETLEQALSDYDGTLIAVSHDRYFINRLATRVLEMKPGGHFDFNGNYEDFVSYRTRMGEGAAPETESQETGEGGEENEYRRAKREKSEKRRLERRISDTEARIANAEQRLFELQRELDDAASDYRRAQRLFEEREGWARGLEELYALWDRLLLQNERDG